MVYPYNDESSLGHHGVVQLENRNSFMDKKVIDFRNHVVIEKVHGWLWNYICITLCLNEF